MKIGYVSKQPPSDHGVAHYAECFRQVLDHLGPVIPIEGLHTVRDSQSLRAAARTAARVHRLGGSLDVLVVELSGRSFAEFASACWFSRRWPEKELWLGVHDAPALTGGLFWIGLLDRRILRRLARTLSRSIGRSFERWLLNRASLVWTLTQPGADGLFEEYELSRIPVVLPHVLPSPTEPAATCVRQPGRIFCPGHTDAGAVLPVLEVLVRNTDAALVVGHCPAQDRERVLQMADALGVTSRVSFTGFLRDEDAIRRHLQKAEFVVRLRAEGAASDNRYASSAPLLASLASGAAILTNDARGLRSHLELHRSAVLIDSVAEAPDALLAMMRDPSEMAAMRARAAESVRSRNSVEAVARELRAASACSTHR